MRALCLRSSVGSALRPAVVEAVQGLSAGLGQLLIRVQAARVLLTERTWVSTSLTRNGQVRETAIPCHEFAGTVSAIGEGVQGFQAGDAIYGTNGWCDEGAAAEFCLSRPEWIAPKPMTLNFGQAASVPISALTAMQGLFEHDGLSAEQTVLIHGGSGAVGAFAVQFAKHSRARVIATALKAQVQEVRELGADEVIAYNDELFGTSVRDVDLVFDTVSSRSWQVLRSGGGLVPIVSRLFPDVDKRTKDAMFIVRPSRQQLAEVGRLLDRGAVTTEVAAVVSLDQAADLFAGKTTRPKASGKSLCCRCD